MNELPAPRQGPGRPLGQLVQPELRLSLGYQDPDRAGSPVKTDHFRIRNADEAFDSAERFRKAYGDEPRELRIMLPSTLEQALDIRHVAFGGRGEGGGGSLKAIGQANFAVRGTLGGPDLLTVWNTDSGVVDEVAIEDETDEVARALGVKLRMTFRFMLPEALGVGSFATVDSTAKKSIDSIWAKCVELYGLFGERVTYAVEPRLRLRPATTRYFDQKQNKWRTSSFYALDLVVPETFEQMFGRLRERDALLAGPQPELEADETRALGEETESEYVDEYEVDDELEPEAVPDEPEPPESQDDSPTQEQRKRLAQIMAELANSDRPPDLELSDGSVVSFEPGEWNQYGKRYIETVFAPARSTSELTGEQFAKLLSHFDGLTIPF